MEAPPGRPMWTKGTDCSRTQAHATKMTTTGSQHTRHQSSETGEGVAQVAQDERYGPPQYDHMNGGDGEAAPMGFNAKKGTRTTHAD